MTREELHSELHRLDCGHKWCGPHGFIFHPENKGGLNIEDMRLHFWGCCANTHLDIAKAFEILRALPDGAGHKRTCDSLREQAGLPENPHCLHVDGRLQSSQTSRVSCG